MLRDVRRRDEDFSQRDRIVRQEVHLQVLRRIRVLVDDASDIDDEPDSQLRDVVPRSSLASKEYDTRVGLLPLLRRQSLQLKVAL